MYKEIICNFNNIREAYQLAHRQKTNDSSVIEFDKDKIYNLHQLQKELEEKKWGDIFIYYRFTIYEPKTRIVDAMIFKGRIVQHILCDKILKPYFEKRLVKENGACRIDKGTDYCLSLVKQGMVDFLKTHSDGFALKMDVRKFFPSIDRVILKHLLSEFPDDEIRELLFYIIDNAPDNSGIPIGNQTSQWFALYYLDRIDRIIKEKYRIKYYTRYMDDLIIIHEDKSLLHLLRSELDFILAEELHLQFNEKTQIFPLHKGISFLGWKLIPVANNRIIQKIDGSKKKNRVKKIKEIKKNYITQKISKKKYNERMRCVRVNLDKGNTYGFQVLHGLR